jgi:CDP-diacylglycerol---glycerol-3-phosphate 3-phosphatidyltransferase
MLPAKLRHAFHLSELAYPANLLTLARLLMLPVALHYLGQPARRWHALGVFGAAMLTDALDGPIARRRQEVSPLGKLLDPIADKIMIDTTALALARTRGFPPWAIGLLITRDLGILLGAALIYRRRAQIVMAQPAGKATTLALTAAMLLYVADGPRSGRPALYASLLPFLYSVVRYFHTFKQQVALGLFDRPEA